MDVATLAQVVTSVTNTLFVIVLAAGYYFTWKVSRRTLEEMKAQRMAIGRPQVIVDDDYDSLPEVNIVVRNVSQGAAKDITFEFSAPVESSNGFVSPTSRTSKGAWTSCRRTVRSPPTGTTWNRSCRSWSRRVWRGASG